MEKLGMLKLGFKISFGLQCRVFSIPRVKRNLVVSLCLERRDYSSSAPVRYVPKKSRKANGNTISQPFNGLKNYEYSPGLDTSSSGYEVTSNGRGEGRGKYVDLKMQNRPGNCENSFLDNVKQESEEETSGDFGFGFGDNELMTETLEDFDEIQEGTTEKSSSCPSIGRTEAHKTKLDAENMAVKLLAARAYTAVELRKKLIRKKFPSGIIEGLINDFQSRGLINDSLYAESFSQSRWSSSTWGPRRIKQALYKKGVSESEADKAVKLVFKDGENINDQESRHGLSKQAMDQLFVQASKQWVRSQGAAKETRKSRMIQWLQYRGFNWAVIGFILKKLESHSA